MPVFKTMNMVYNSVAFVLGLNIKLLFYSSHNWQGHSSGYSHTVARCTNGLLLNNNSLSFLVILFQIFLSYIRNRFCSQTVSALMGFPLFYVDFHMFLQHVLPTVQSTCVNILIYSRRPLTYFNLQNMDVGLIIMTLEMY